MLTRLGIGLALANWVSFLAIALLVIPAYDYRLRAEEKALTEQLGEPYAAYIRHTRRSDNWCMAVQVVG